MMRYIPKQYKRFVYCICSQDPLIDAMEVSLSKLGISREKGTIRMIRNGLVKEINLHHIIVRQFAVFLAVLITISSIVFALLATP